jgi:23S rRNA pseudouridine1911/1915/1917 synthase
MATFFGSIGQKKKVKHLVSEGGLRVDRYCSVNLPQLSSLNRAKKWIKKGYILLNGQQVETSRFVHKDDVITITIPTSSLSVWEKKLTAHLEDDHLAIIEKPAGFHVSGNYAKTVRKALPHNLWPSPKEDSLLQPEPIHRLDRRTSGLLIIAKTNLSRHLLGDMLQKRQIAKTYHSICIGKAISGSSNEMIDGKEAQSSWTVLSTHPSVFTEWISHIEVQITTGRQHQIRRHLYGEGHPVLGDDLYCIGSPLRSKGLYLFATQLAFIHPITNKNIHLTLPTPDKIFKRIEYEKRCFKA